jgi:hypothetical protein
MLLAVQIMGELMIAAGVVGILMPGMLRRLYGALENDAWRLPLALLKAAAGVAFWLAADDTRVPVLMRVLGAGAVLAAPLIFFRIPPLPALMRWVQGAPDSMLRVYGLLAAAAGAGVLWITGLL